MVNKFIMGIGAVCSAVSLGVVSFAAGYGLAGSGSTAGARHAGTGLLLSIAVAVWGIFVLQIWRRPGKGE